MKVAKDAAFKANYTASVTYYATSRDKDAAF
jgi:hypothetical protein